MKQIVIILCPGHCGSTLLGYILGSHSKAAYVDEIGNLYKYLNNPNRAICGVCGEKCEFWDKRVNRDGFLDRYKKKNHWQTKILGQVLPRHCNDNIYSRLFDVTGSNLLIDSSHDAHWAEEVVRQEHGSAVVIIHMLRDGRAYLASQKRKGKNLHQRARLWVNRIRDIEKFKKKYSRLQVIQVRYEALGSNTQKTVTEITNLLGIEFEPAMIEYWVHEHHNVGGNIGARSPIARRMGRQVENSFLRTDMHYYEDWGEQIFFDERWKTELSMDELELFMNVCGDVNKQLGYS